MNKNCKLYIVPLLFVGLLPFQLIGQQNIKDSSFVQFFYPNKQVSSEGVMIDEKPDGYWRTYYVTGIIKSEGKRTNFLLDSIWNFYNQAGELTEQISYKLGEKSGYSNKYIYNNPQNPGQPTLISSELYIKGKKEGKSFYYHQTGELKLVVFFENGKKQGLSREFSKDSILLTVVQYKDNYVVDRERVNRKDEKGRRQGTYREYYENGKIKKEQHYLDDALHGYYREFDGRGELVLAMRYERGKIVEEIDEDMKELLDMKSTYDQQGRLIFNGGYKEGVPVGIHRFYDTTGVVENAYLYNEMGQKVAEGIIDEQGNRKGSWTNFYPGGAIKSKGTYVNNQRSGTWTYNFPTGGIEQKGKFERDRYRGIWRWYYPNGNIWREESYFNGREDGSFVEYDPTGKILTKGDYIGGEKEGEWIYKVGDHEERGSYMIGLREGEWKYYYPSGKLKYEGTYSQGNPDKRHKYYYPDGTLKEEQYYELGIRDRNWKKYDDEGNLLMTITYKNNEELRINGVKIKLPDDDIKLIR
jgi:uncharacterized protein